MRGAPGATAANSACVAPAKHTEAACDDSCNGHGNCAVAGASAPVCLCHARFVGATCLEAVFEVTSATSLRIRVALVVGAAALAVTVPNFGFVVSLMGAFTTMLVSFILPVAFYLYACRATLGPLAVGANALIIVIGLIGMVVGVQSTLASQM